MPKNAHLRKRYGRCTNSSGSKKYKDLTEFTKKFTKKFELGFLIHFNQCSAFQIDERVKLENLNGFSNYLVYVSKDLWYTYILREDLAFSEKFLKHT
jgi:hypothetical protein